MKKLRDFLRLIAETYREVKKKDQIRKERSEAFAHREYLKSHRDEIIKLTCECADVDYSKFMANMGCNKRIYLYPRQISIALMHHSLMFTQEVVEEYFHKYHPATIHSTNVVKHLLEMDEEFRFRYYPVIKRAQQLNDRTYSKLGVKEFFKD